MNIRERDTRRQSTKPSLFLRTTASFAPHGQPLLFPPEFVELDYEGEIAIVIGAEGRRIPMDRRRRILRASASPTKVRYGIG